MSDKPYIPHCSSTITYVDYDNRDSYKLCLKPYNIKCLSANPIDEDSVEITIYGEQADVENFLDDFEEDCLEPMENMGRDIEYDEDYLAWLNNEIEIFDNCTAAESEEA